MWRNPNILLQSPAQSFDGLAEHGSSLGRKFLLFSISDYKIDWKFDSVMVLGSTENILIFSFTSKFAKIYMTYHARFLAAGKKCFSSFFENLKSFYP